MNSIAQPEYTLARRAVRYERTLGLLLTGVFLVTVLVILPRRPINHVDFTTYVVASLAWSAGENPYTLTPDAWKKIAAEVHSPYLEPLPFPYSPISFGLFLPFAHLAKQVGVSVAGYAWDIFKLALLVLTLGCAQRWVALSFGRLSIATLLWLPLISDFSLGQSNLILLAIFSAALALSDPGRGVLLGVGVYLKGLLLAPLTILLPRKRIRVVLWGFAGLLVPAALILPAISSLLWFYLSQRFLPLMISPVVPVTDPSLLWLTQTSHLHYPAWLRIAGLVVGVLAALRVRQERDALVAITGTAALFSGVTERGHLVLFLPCLWLLLEAAQEQRLNTPVRWVALIGFAVFTLGSLSSLFTIDLPRLLGLSLHVSPVEFAAPILSVGALLLWVAFVAHLSHELWRERTS